MSISVNIHSIDTTAKTCIVTIRDNGVLISDYKNIGLTLNLDGTANTAYINNRVKRVVQKFRYRNANNIIIHTS
jgi:mevalonate pyrophosphate decarboxylase